MTAITTTDQTKSAPAAAAAEAPVTTPTATPQPAAAPTAPGTETGESMVNLLSDAVTAKFAPLFEALLEATKGNSEATQLLAQKVAQIASPAAVQPAEVTPAPAAPQATAPSAEASKMLEMAAALAEVKKSVADVANVIKGITPPAAVRDESVKAAPQKDKMAVFDSLFTGGRRTPFSR